MRRRRFLIVDGNGLACRLWWAHEHGVPDRFAATVQRLCKSQEAALAAVAWDAPGRTWRQEIYPGYKGDRKPKPAQLVTTIAECQAIPSLRVAYRIAPGFEADDIIGTYADAFVERGDEVVIVTEDKDLCQLVGPLCWIVNAKGEERREAQVREKFGVAPCHVRAWLSWAGDKVDGLPGVAGVGPKGATLNAGTGAVGDRMTYELAGLAVVPGLIEGGSIPARL